jgi:formate dehydrogenase subunit delta
MTDDELNHLIKMLNQIAANLDQGDEVEVVAGRVADHMRRFWSPSMKKSIAAYLAADGSGLTASSRQAVTIIGAEG